MIHVKLIQDPMYVVWNIQITQHVILANSIPQVKNAVKKILKIKDVTFVNLNQVN